MKPKSPRIAARAILMQENRLLLVNAFRTVRSDLWCAPGGGVETGTSLHETLIREVHEETGLDIAVGAPCLINEFHDPDTGFHQVEVFFRGRIRSGTLQQEWRDPAGVVTERRFFSRTDLSGIRFKPDSLPDIAWGDMALSYDPLERLVM